MQSDRTPVRELVAEAKECEADLMHRAASAPPPETTPGDQLRWADLICRLADALEEQDDLIDRAQNMFTAMERDGTYYPEGGIKRWLVSRAALDAARKEKG